MASLASSSSTEGGDGHAEGTGGELGGRRVGVVDHAERATLNLVGEQLGVHPPDAPDPEHTDPNRCDVAAWSAREQDRAA